MPEPDKTPELPKSQRTMGQTKTVGEWAWYLTDGRRPDCYFDDKVEAILAQGKRAGRKEGTRAMKDVCSHCHPLGMEDAPSSYYRTLIENLDSDAVAEGIG